MFSNFHYTTWVHSGKAEGKEMVSDVAQMTLTRRKGVSTVTNKKRYLQDGITFRGRTIYSCSCGGIATLRHLMFVLFLLSFPLSGKS